MLGDNLLRTISAYVIGGRSHTRKSPSTRRNGTASTRSNLVRPMEQPCQRNRRSRDAARCSGSHEMRSQLLDQDSPNKQQYVLDLSNSLSNLTILQRDEYKESSEGVRPTRHVLHQDPETIQCKLGCALTNLADRFIEINLPNQSVDAAKKSVEIFNSFPKEAHRDELALALFSYYNALFGIGVYDQALSEIKKATNILSQNTSTLDINISLLIYSNVFLQHSFLGNEEDARSALLKVRALVDSSASYPTSVEPELGRSLLRSSSGCQKLGDWEEAANACEDAVKVFRRLV